MAVSEPNRHLSSAGEQVRAFNHTSRSTGDGWEFPSHSYDALGSLAYLARMLPQALEQATVPAMRVYENGRLLIDGGGDPDEQVVRLRKSLDAALVHAQRLAGAIDGMHSATSPMAVDTTGLPGFDDEDGE
jgi:hypothetical protein